MRLQTTLFLGAMIALASARALAQDDDGLDRTPRKCISIGQIRDTEVLDDESILFYGPGRRVYRNVFDRPCSGLARSGRFMYRTRTRQLCSSDTIQVIRQFAGRLDPGMVCFLGEFHPITREEADFLTLDPDERSAIEQNVTMSPVELPPEEAEGEAPADSRDSEGAAVEGVDAAEPVPSNGPADGSE